MARARDFIPALKYGHKIYPEDLVDGGGLPLSNGNVLFVDGDASGDGSGSTWADAFNDIQSAVTAASAGDVIYIAERTVGVTGTDPVSYAETIIIPNTKPHLSLIGVSRGLTQGGLPQIKIGAGSTAMITVRAPGCLIANLGINGASSTGGGIKLEDNGTTYVAFGTTIANCHFKNCVSSGHASTGGAVYSTGSPWQIRISRFRFYKNIGGIVMVNTSYSVPQDWIIEDCEFGSSVATDVDADIVALADGILGLIIRRCDFSTVDVPSHGSGDYGKYIQLGAGNFGMISDCNFACLVNPTATEVTFGAAGTAAIIPTTVRIANCWGETSSTTERGWVNRV